MHTARKQSISRNEGPSLTYPKVNYAIVG